MRDSETSLSKIILTMSIALVLMCTMAIPALEKNSAEYVIAVISLFINVVLISFILIRIKLKKNKKNNR